MNKIKTTLRISEVDTLVSTLVRLYRAAVSDGGPLAKDENLASLMAEVEKFSAGLSLAIKSDRVESSLDEADVARDGIIRDISNLLTGYASIPVPEKKAAAGRLLSIFQKYGRGIITKSYAEESSLIESMLGDFFSESAKADVQLLEGVGELLSSLRSAQDVFHGASDAFTAAKVGKGESASNIKKNLLVLLNGRLLSYLTALAQVSDYADFAAKCATEIDRANSPSGGRGKQAAAENTASVVENPQT